VTYGYGTKEVLSPWNPDYWVTDLRELTGIPINTGIGSL
jgi:hypothetical protein